MTILDNFIQWLQKAIPNRALPPILGKAGPPRPGLVPQSGDPQHPYRWIRPPKVSAHKLPKWSRGYDRPDFRTTPAHLSPYLKPGANAYGEVKPRKTR